MSKKKNEASYRFIFLYGSMCLSRTPNAKARRYLASLACPVLFSE